MYRKILSVVSLLCCISFWAFRYGWHFTKFGMGVNLTYAFIAMIIVAALTLFAVIKKKSKKWIIPLSVFVLLALLANITMALLRMGDLKIYGRYVLESMLVVVPVALAAAVFFTPLFKRLWLRIAVLAAVFFAAVCMLYGLYPISYTSEPVVFEHGEDYAIVWTTNARGMAWVEVEKDGQTHVFYNARDGKRLANTTVHTVLVPKETLEGSSYEAFTKRLWFQSPNKVIFGGTLSGESIYFKSLSDKTQLSFMSVSDYHSMPSGAKKTVANAGELDFIVLNGDLMSFINDEAEIINNILQVAHDMSGGGIPVIVTRGNHELMSFGTDYLRKYIPLPDDKFYFTFSYGEMLGIVLDAAIDKPDNHVTYGGTVDNDTYRDEQTAWLEELIAQNAGEGYSQIVVLNHVPLTALSNPPYDRIMKAWTPLLNELGVDISISGHTHKHKIDAPAEGRNFVCVEDGANQDYIGRGNIATKITLSGDSITVEFMNQKGEVLYSESMSIN